MKVTGKNVLNNKRGQGLTEYAVVLSLVALVAIGVMTVFGGAIKSKVGALVGAVTGDTALFESETKRLAADATKAKDLAKKKLGGMKTDSDAKVIGVYDK